MAQQMPPGGHWDTSHGVPVWVPDPVVLLPKRKSRLKKVVLIVSGIIGFGILLILALGILGLILESKGVIPSSTPAAVAVAPTQTPILAAAIAAPTQAPAATQTYAPSPTVTAAPLVHKVAPVVAQNPHCRTGPLTSKTWFLVNYRPANYVGCKVDIVGQLYASQPEDQDMSYNMYLDPMGDSKYVVFAADYTDTPPNIADNAYIRVVGTIEAAVQSINTITDADEAIVPQVRVRHIWVITKGEAIDRGLG